MPSPQGITRAEAREICSNAVLRNGGYNPADATNVARLDMAIDAAFTEFCERTKHDITSDTSITLTQGSDVIDVTSITGFDVTKFMQSFLTNSTGVPMEMRFDDYRVVLQIRKGIYYRNGWVPGMPPPLVNGDGVGSVLAGWSADGSKIQLSQVFAQDMTLHLDWFKPFNRATGSDKFNVDRRHCDAICWFGVPLYYDSMQSSQPMVQSPLVNCQKRFDALIARCSYSSMNKMVAVRLPTGV